MKFKKSKKKNLEYAPGWPDHSKISWYFSLNGSTKNLENPSGSPPISEAPNLLPNATMVTGLAGAKNGGCSSSQTEQNNITKCYEMGYIPPKKNQVSYFFSRSCHRHPKMGMGWHFILLFSWRINKNSKNPVELIILLSRCKCNSKSTSKEQQHSIEMCWCFTPFFFQPKNLTLWHY